MTIIAIDWPPNPQHVRHYKLIAATSDARTGTPVGPVHYVQAKRPCDRTYANQYLRVRCGLMTADEIVALEQAEADYEQAVRDIEDAERRLAAARKRIVGLVAPGGDGAAFDGVS